MADGPGFNGDDPNCVYETPAALWASVEKDKDKAWYGEAVAYWDRQPPTYDGVLGGQAAVNDADVRESRLFLAKLLGADVVDAAAAGARALTAVDCGAGVGRVSEQLLLPVCATVDVVEPSAHLIEAARTALTAASAEGRVRGAPGRFLQCGLQAFDPEAGRYDVIWVQWALLYLTDDDAVAFIRRALAALRPGGALVVKENVCSKGFVVDTDDRSVTRSPAYVRALFERAGAVLTAEARQRDFPAGLFAVRMFGVRK